MFAVVVTIRTRAGTQDRFLPQIAENARRSLSDEPGCLRFDICTDPARPDEVLLYELYTDRAAFDAHLASAHFRAFDQDSAPLIASKQVRTYSEVAT